MNPQLRKGSSTAGSSSSLTGPKFGATLDLLRVLSSNLFKLDSMLKVHDEADIDNRQKLTEALDSVRKLVTPIDSKPNTRLTNLSLRPSGMSTSVVSLFRQATLESMKEVQGKLVVVQESVRLKHKENASRLQSWIQLLNEANIVLEAAIVTYEKTYMQVKMHYSLYLHLIEAKLLPAAIAVANGMKEFAPSSSSASSSSASGSGEGPANASGGLLPNPYVEIWVDSSRRARTRANWVDDAPVWNQTFDVMIPADAEELTFKLFSESKDGLSDPSFLGKSDVLLSSLKDRHIATEWIPFYSRGIGHVTEASGLHAIIKYKPGATPQQGNLTVIVVEAKKLVEDGADLPSAYCRMSVIDQGERGAPSLPTQSSAESVIGPNVGDLSSFGSSGYIAPTLSTPSKSSKDKKEEKAKEKEKEARVQKSSVVKKNDNPHWEEGFIFKFRWNANHTTKLLIELHDDRQSKQTFMGAIVIPLNAMISDPATPAEIDRWFKLKRRAGKSDDPSTSLPQIGQLKLDMQFREERLLPDSFYDPLFDLFQDPNRFLIIFCSKVAGNPTLRKEIMKSIVGAFEMKNRGAWLLKSVSSAEVDETWDLSVLFRGNSIASSCLDTFMRTVGRQVLDATLRPILRELYKSNKSYELDPTRVPKGTDMKKNLSAFIETLNWIWESIRTTADKIPITMRRVLAHLRAQVSIKWPNDSNSKYISVTSFLFLRFFCPALMSPQSFDLVDEMPTALTSRNLALVSKTLMNLANFVEYGAKEPNLSPLNEWLNANFPKMREYIDGLVDDPEGADTPIIHNANATLFIFGREMNHLRDFLSTRSDKLRAEQEAVSVMLEGVTAATTPTENVDDGVLSSSSLHSIAEKQHCSDDEDDVVEDLVTGRKVQPRKQFRRVSSKSRMAAESSNGKSLSGLIIGKDTSNDPAQLRLYLDVLNQTLTCLDALNSFTENHQPLLSPRSLLSSSTPTKPSKSPRGPSSLKPAMLARAGSLESGTLASERKRALTSNAATKEKPRH